MSKAVYQLEPLTCPSCIKKIETTLSKTAGVESAKVMFNSSKVRTEFDENEIKADKIEETITKLGYPVLSVKVS
ncbi:MAG: heavy-metal-associated domain-containing protein [Carnobacterium sp.]|uniref:heavy-metal-associated domain-containing protein n=1 Tax=unclassified Carnobacterium TaxID=257487 RepID=UPI0019136E6F|nr:heavy-metal-associated domain-containing protein [Carnobacterium sp. CS13]QQP69758.1 heavy-metal-associated domain-containing protein [Carnobacterium sp. CS13]